VWTVPAERMKADRQHRIPLCDRAVVSVETLSKARAGDFVFPGQRDKKPLSNMTSEMVLRRIGVADATVHGFRSSFRN
jgi:integrase